MGQKLQLGETMPVVSARMVHHILKGDFVDMAELSEDHLEFGQLTERMRSHSLHTSCILFQIFLLGLGLSVISLELL